MHIEIQLDQQRFRFSSINFIILQIIVRTNLPVKIFKYFLNFNMIRFIKYKWIENPANELSTYSSLSSMFYSRKLICNGLWLTFSYFRKSIANVTINANLHLVLSNLILIATFLSSWILDFLHFWRNIIAFYRK